MFSCHVYLVSFGVRQLLSRARETKTVRKEANRQATKGRNRKQRAHCRWAFTCMWKERFCSSI